ncbi:uncharacterized protein RSE6_10221 [Rhynchosporium secalis]|uniref:Uncharacterized protein n=1 Tax=Rhynchosporium secalis TaxID=38038 RepID=A0A1E1MJZ7_RHYSE|nr:uncharacterized protein RSE6_10221 [Rhynchosporium secalis]
MPILDLSIPEAKNIFDLNFWACISVIQAFILLLTKAKDGAVIVTTHLPILRQELEGFDIKVVDLKTGGVKSNIFANLTHGELPLGSIYNVARKDADLVLAGEKLKSLKGVYCDSDIWAENVVSDVTKANPPYQMWRGGQAWMERFARFATVLPVLMFAGQMKKLTGLDDVTRKIQESRLLEFAQEEELGMKLA